MPDDFVESLPGLFVSRDANPPPAAPQLDQFRLDTPLSTEGRLLVVVLRELRELTAEVRGMRAQMLGVA